MATNAMPPISQLRGRPLGRILIKMGKLTRAQVSEALEVQKKKRGPLGQLLIEMGYVDKGDVNRALAAQVGMESIKLADIDVEETSST
jgi:type IV pilus assembly protein PilB